MIGYVTLGTNDIKRAAKYYDELLGSLGAKRLMNYDTFIVWGTVHAMHRKALALGSKDEGAPGPRGDGWYCAYFRDPDGNKLNFYCIT
ncbi:MAG: VOC family protein [Steroidobacteraceae bacterium]